MHQNCSHAALIMEQGGEWAGDLKNILTIASSYLSNKFNSLGSIAHLAVEASIWSIVVVERVKLDSTLRAAETVPEDIKICLFW